MEFIGRKEELEQLERYFNSDTINTCAIFGRRRVGKSALIDRFCEDKPNIKFNLSGTDPEKMLDHIAMDISKHTGDNPESVRSGIKDFDSLMMFLHETDGTDSDRS